MAKQNAKYLALASVYDVRMADIENDPALMYILNRGLMEVTNYPGLLPNETEELREQRGTMVYTGNPTQIGNHIKKFTPDYKGYGAWDVVFSTFKNLDLPTLENSSKESSTQQEENTTPLPWEDVKQPIQVEPPMQATDGSTEAGITGSTEIASERESSDSPVNGVNNINNTIKEDMVMSEQQKQVTAEEQNEMTMKELEEKLGAGNSVETGKDVVKSEGAMPANANLETAIKASQAKLQADMATRLAYSQSATITEVLNRRPAMASILPNGTETKGSLESLSDVQNQYKSFCEKTGLKENPDGSIVFEKVPESSKGQAKALYDQFQKAMVDPAIPWDIFFSKSKGAWNVVGFQSPTEQSIQYLTRDEVTSTLIDFSLGMINVAKGGQLRLIEATKRKSTKKASNQRSTASKSKSAFTGVVSPRFTDRTVTESAGTIYVVDGDTVEVKKGPKSLLCCTYLTGETHEDKNHNIVPDTRTYRVTLSCPQRKLTIQRPELKKFASSAAVGAVINPINLNDNKEVNNAIADIAKVIATLSIKGDTNNTTIKAVRAGMEEANQAKVAAQAADMQNMGL